MRLHSVLLPGLLFLAACGASAPSAEAQGGMTDEEFDRRLREALIRNPGVIVEAIEAYRANLEEEALSATRETVAERLATLTSGESGHAIGASPEEAELVIVEFFDYHCGFCRQALDDVLARAETGDVRVIFQELPILREESRDAALTALAAGEIGEETYARVHTELMRSNALLDEDGIRKALKRAGVDAERVLQVREEKREALEARLDRSMDLAADIGVGGTPFFVVTDPKTGAFEVLEGYREETLDLLINEVRG